MLQAALTAVVLLSAVTARLWAVLRITRRQRDDALKTKLQRASRHGTDPLAHAPFAACTTDHSGKITAASPEFRSLFTGAGSLAELDDRFGAQLSDSTVFRGQPAFSRLVLPPDRHFAMVSWPAGTGGAFTFIEQTAAYARHVHAGEFESELLKLLEQGGQALAGQPLGRELTAVGAYFREQQHVRRRYVAAGRADMRAAVRTAAARLGLELRRRHVTLSLTLPPSARVALDGTDAAYLADTLLGSCTALCLDGSDLRVSLRADVGRWSLRVEFSGREPKFTFSQGADRPQAVQFAALREVALQRGGGATIHRSDGRWMVTVTARAAKRPTP